MVPSHLQHLAAVLAVHALVLFHGAQADNFQNVDNIRDFLYQEMSYTGGWYRNLNASTPTGSTAPQRGVQASAVLMNASHVEWPLTAQRILVCNLTNFESTLLTLLSDPVSQANVAGILVDPNGPLPSHYSSSDAFPGAFNAPYANKAYAWNPYGSGLARQRFNFPVTYMSFDMAAKTSWRANYNNDQNFKGALYWGTMSMDMFAQYNSTYCLLGTASSPRTCDPLGGFSAWAAIPPMQPLYPNLDPSYMPSGLGSLIAPATMPITLVTAQIDSNSIFHDYTQGSDSPLSGLIAMLAAMEILRATNASSTYTRQLAFLALQGEPWDYMGSRRLMFEMYRNSTATSGLNLTLIDQVIELGQIGRAYNSTSNATTLFIHSQLPGTGSTTYGDATALVSALQSAAAGTTEANVNMYTASTANPGIPPSSLMSLLRHKPSIKGVVLTEFDSKYRNPYYQSEQDTGAYIDVQAMVAASIALARTLHTLASPGTPVPLKFDSNALSLLVTELAYCLMVDGDPPYQGLWCNLVQSYIGPTVSYSDQNAQATTQVLPWRYIGPQASADLPDATNVTNGLSGGLKPAISRFLFNFMANTTATNHTSIVCDPYVNYCPANMVCVGWYYGINTTANAATMGRCTTATARFVLSTSTRLYFQSVVVNDTSVYYTGMAYLNDTAALYSNFTSQYGWPEDPLWTESQWAIGTPFVMVYMAEPRSTQVAILVSGILLTIATGLAAHFVQKAFEMRLKSE